MKTQTTKTENFDRLKQELSTLPLSPVGECLTIDDMIELALDLVPSECLDQYLTHIESCLQCAESSSHVMQIAEFWEGERISYRQEKLETYLNSGSIEIVSTLIHILEDNDANVRLSVVSALDEVGSSEIIPSLIRVLEDKDANVRCNAAYILGEMFSEEALPALIQLLEDEDADVRRTVADTLGDIGACDAVPALIHQLENENNNNVKRVAIEAIRLICSDETKIYLTDFVLVDTCNEDEMVEENNIPFRSLFTWLIDDSRTLQVDFNRQIGNVYLYHIKNGKGCDDSIWLAPNDIRFDFDENGGCLLKGDNLEHALKIAEHFHLPENVSRWIKDITKKDLKKLPESTHNNVVPITSKWVSVAKFTRLAAAAEPTEVPKLPTAPLKSDNGKFRLTVISKKNKLEIRIQALGSASAEYANKYVGLSITAENDEPVIKFQLDFDGDGSCKIDDSIEIREALLHPVIVLFDKW